MAAITQRTLARNDLPKTVSVEFLATHKTDRTGGVLDQKRFGFTDARHLRDGAFFFSSRLLPGYLLEEHTGARNAPDPGQLILPPGTGLKGGTDPNRFTCTLNNEKDPAGRTLTELDDYELVGAEIIVRRGAERDGAGNAHSFPDYVEVFFGYIETVDTGTDEIRIRATSPEGRHAGNMLGRRVFQGLGYGIELDNTSAGGTAVAWLDGSGAAFAVDAGGEWAFSQILTFLAKPSDVTGCVRFSMLHYDRIFVRIRESDDKVEVFHNDGASPAVFTFPNFVLDGSHIERPLSFGVRYDGSTLYLYVDTVQVDSVASTKDPAGDSVTLRIGRNAVGADPGSFIVYEIWTSNADPGHAAMAARQAGPLEFNAADQPDIFGVWKFLEGGISPAETVTTDLSFDGGQNDLIIQGTAAFSDSEEGDKPSVSPRPRGLSKPFVLGRRSNFPPTFRSVAGVADPAAVWENAPWKLRLFAAREDGVRGVVAFTETGTRNLRTNLGVENRSAIESPDLAKVVFGPVLSGGGVELTAGSELEITTFPAEDGVYTVTGKEGGRWVFVTPVFSAEALSALVTITVPKIGDVADVTNGTDGTITTKDLVDGQLTNDVEREDGPTPTASASAIFLRNGRDRAETATIDQVSFTDGHEVTIVGDVGELDLPWSLGIVGGRDISYRKAEAELLESYFAWTSDTARVDIDPGPAEVLVQGIRMGQFHPPDLANVAADHAFTAQQVDESTIRRLATLSPAWSVKILHRPNDAPIDTAQLPGILSPAEREALSSEYSEIEVFLDTSIRDDFPNARQVFWRTNLYKVDDATLVGQRVAAFLTVPRTWWSFRLDTVRPERILIGEDLSVAHPRFKADGTPLAFVALGKGSGITKRGLDLVAVS